MKIRSISELKYFLKKDYARIDSNNFRGGYLRFLFTNHSIKILFWLRICQYLSSKGRWCCLPFAVARIIYKHQEWKTGIQIPYHINLGAGAFFPHHGCIIVNGNTVIGENCTIYQGVTIGYSGHWPNGGIPTIGNNVTLYPGAKIFGCIRLGDNVTIGANCVVCKDVPNNSIVYAPLGVIKNIQNIET